jgi:hypothetical protein
MQVTDIYGFQSLIGLVGLMKDNFHICVGDSTIHVTISCSYYLSVQNSENYSLFHKYQSTIKKCTDLSLFFFPMFVFGSVFFTWLQRLWRSPLLQSLSRFCTSYR